MAEEAQPLGLTQPGPTWQELVGAKNWEGLLDPLDDQLRELILRCGDMCQVTYDTFINDQNSEYCGSSRFAKADLLQKTAFPGGADLFDVVGYLYATARVSVPEAFLLKSKSREMWDRESNWIGYVVVSNDVTSKVTGRREIYVAWRGTCRDYEWIDVLGAKLESAKPLLRPENYNAEKLRKAQGKRAHKLSSNGCLTCFNNCGGFANGKDDETDMMKGKDNGNASSSDDEDDQSLPKVMQGWMTIYTSEDPKSSFTKLSARTQLLTKLKQLIEQYKGENLSITFAGHSLGATLSVVSAFDVAENLSSEIPVTAIVFGCPKVGNNRFKEIFDSYSNLKVLHVRNVIDLIPHYPFKLMGYVNIGFELEIDTRKSHYLKDSKNPSDWHNLQAILHVVSGWHGSKKDFSIVGDRSVALVNKSCDFLTEECLVPPSWWVEKNKGMVLKDGKWILSGPEESPVPEFE